MPIQFDANQYIIDPPNREVLSEIFKELEFRSIAKRILGEEGWWFGRYDKEQKLYRTEEELAV